MKAYDFNESDNLTEDLLTAYRSEKQAGHYETIKRSIKTQELDIVLMYLRESTKHQPC